MGLCLNIYTKISQKRKKFAQTGSTWKDSLDISDIVDAAFKKVFYR